MFIDLVSPGLVTSDPGWQSVDDCQPGCPQV